MSVRARGQGVTFSGGERDVVLMNSKQLWLLAQDLYKIKPINITVWQTGDNDTNMYVENDKEQ